VINTGRAQLDGELNGWSRAELVPVQPETQPRGPSGKQHRTSFVDAERVRRSRFAEDVDPTRQGRRAGEHRPGDQVDVARPVALPLGRHDVSTEEGGLGCELPRDEKAADLLRDAEAIAALDLHGSSSLGAHLGDPASYQRGQLVGGGRAGRVDRAGDAASVVWLAGHPSDELGTPVAGKDQVRVGVYEAGDQGSPVEIDLPIGGRGGACRSGPGDPLLVHNHRSAGLNTEAVVTRAVAGDQFADAGNDDAGHG
jgi:hypothetical protein